MDGHDIYCQCSECRLNEALDNPQLPDYRDIRRALNETQWDLNKQLKQELTGQLKRGHKPEKRKGK